MKVQEIVNKDLYEELLKYEPEYYRCSVGNCEQTKTYANKLFNQIYELLLPFNPKLKPNFYHHNKSKDRIELWKEHWVLARKGKNTIQVRQDDWIEVYAKGGSQIKGDSIDPETKLKTKQEITNTMEEW